MLKNYTNILIGPWVIFSLLVIFLDIQYIEFNNIVIIPIFFAVFFSVIFFSLGFKKSNINLENKIFLNDKIDFKSSKEPPFIGLLVILALIGCISNTYLDVTRTLNNETFLNVMNQNTQFFYNLRISKSTSSELVGSNFQFISKALFSLSFFFYIHNFTKKFFFYQWAIIFMSLFNNLITGGRFYFIYFLIIFFASRAKNLNINFSSSLTLKNFIVFIVLFGLLLFSFSLRAPQIADVNFDLLSYYKYSNGIESIAFDKANFGIFDKLRELILILIIYITHSFYFLSQHYESFGFQGYAYGGYTFNLIYRIINTIFNTNLLVIQDFYGLDFTLGRYATFAKNLIADFGVVGMVIFYSICSYIFGIAANYRNYFFSFRIIYYWLLIFFLLAPLINLISSGFISLMFVYLILYTKIELKKNIR